MHHHVKSFEKINRHGQSTVDRTGLVETPCDLVGKGEEGSGGGPVGTETMLSGGNWEVVVKLWKQEAFFDSRAEEGDGSRNCPGVALRKVTRKIINMFTVFKITIRRRSCHFQHQNSQYNSL